MIIEEKTKAYDEALEKARMYRDNAKAVEDYAAVARYENIFPQLCESEDERMRKRAIAILKQQRDYWSYDGPMNKFPPATPRKDLVDAIDVALAYLEKQKESKELPLMDGNADLYFDEWNQQKQNPTKRQCFEEGIRYAQRLQKEQKPAEWSEKDKIMLNMIEYRLKDWDNIKAQQGYQDDCTLPSPIKWIKFLPKRFNLQQKKEWSKEEEEIIQSLIRGVQRSAFFAGIRTDKIISFLRDIYLHPQRS